MYTRVQGFASALDDLYCRGSACAPTGPGNDPQRRAAAARDAYRNGRKSPRQQAGCSRNPGYSSQLGLLSTRSIRVCRGFPFVL
jgi:hypothetical protein